MSALLGHFGVPLILTSDDGCHHADDRRRGGSGDAEPCSTACAPMAITTPTCCNSEVSVLNAVSALYRATLSRRNVDGEEIDCPTITFLVTDDVAGLRIVVLATQAQ